MVFSLSVASMMTDGWVTACFQSFCLVGSAELFDKTWFVALLMALRHPKGLVFTSCFSALAAHVGIAAVFGYGISKTMPIRVLHFSAAALYTVFAVLYFIDWHKADPNSDIISAGKEEAGESIPSEFGESSYGSTEEGKLCSHKPSSSASSSSSPSLASFSSSSADRKKETNKELAKVSRIFTQCFMAMFIAEWGDRTQIAMVGQHASQPLIPVCVGSLMAFFLLTFSAVLAGWFLMGTRVSEKTVYFFAASSFMVFAILAAHDGLKMKPASLVPSTVELFELEINSTQPGS